MYALTVGLQGVQALGVETGLADPLRDINLTPMADGGIGRVTRPTLFGYTAARADLLVPAGSNGPSDAGAAVGGGIDAPGEAGDDRQPLRGEVAGTR